MSDAATAILLACGAVLGLCLSGCAVSMIVGRAFKRKRPPEGP